jgi:FkbM family methyltransferase
MPKSIRDHRILSGPSRGLHIVTSWHDYPTAILGSTERPLLRWLQKSVRPGETWLDIGAHCGYIAIALGRLVGPEGRVFAFEPTPSTTGHLTQTRVLNNLQNLTVLPVALGSPEELELKRLPVVRGMASSTLQGGERTETILVARLDWLWPKICGLREQIDGVKIDVEGMEIMVLRGMAKLLRAFKPKLVIELHPGVARGELLDLVESVGYSRRGVPIEPDEQGFEPKYVDDHSYAFLAT